VEELEILLVLKRILQDVNRNMMADWEAFTMDTRLADELKLDSLTLLAVLFRCEELTGITLSKDVDQTDGLRTVKDIVRVFRGAHDA
jgi:acyl carrier protein